MGGKLLSHKAYVKMAVPFMLATVTQPLLGAVDTAAVGKLESAIFIGGVSIGTTLFNTLYWLFGFLRVTTTSYSAKALGANNEVEVREALLHPLVLSLLVGSLFIVCRLPIWQMAMLVLRPEQGVQVEAYKYYSILIWGAPFVLINYVLLGWLMGQAKVRGTVVMQLIGNVINIILDILFVTKLHLGVTGVALATLIAQVLTFVLGMYEVHKLIHIREFRNKELWQLKKAVYKFAGIRDLMIRTICLLLTNNVFMRLTTSFGTSILACNTILLQIESMMAYLYEGIANAASVFAGQAVGEKSKELLKLTIIRTLQWCSILTVILTVSYILWYKEIIKLFTDLEEIVHLTLIYGKWLLIYPLLGGFGLSLYGIFTGTMATKAVKVATILSMFMFLVTLMISLKLWGNHSLWLGYILFYFGRGVFLLPYLRQSFRKIEAENLIKGAI